MSIKIVDTLGNIKKWIVNACDVQLLDIDGKFKNKNLEDAMKEIGSGTEENMTRIENELTTARGVNDNLNDRLELDKTGILNTIGSEDLTTNAKNIKGAVNEVNEQLSEKANKSDFTSLMSSNGWSKNAITGQIEQWGIVNIPSGGGNINFPIAFPNNVFQPVITLDSTSPVVISTLNVTETGMSILHGSASSQGIRYRINGN